MSDSGRQVAREPQRTPVFVFLELGIQMHTMHSFMCVLGSNSSSFVCAARTELSPVAEFTLIQGG